ncbi:ATP-dependent RNA helicase HrpA [Thiorhodovibrio frisius]|uniref:ATP-dependent helicase HrpA n=1 Tax=Thiorhodovibrio frisius TaxID=631362 RepID=H8Z748_9GAMM|nr:ATP-dependent RNA helicase HrpA [Thiorhodovibrio frisius]EIC20847.1 ATP-dependent helicase HrpA [Thiorhodovibrio frisius]WPL21899.1 ATP-dependent RNA helicase HrpB [Thiorhodovibrio frisius]
MSNALVNDAMDGSPTSTALPTQADLASCLLRDRHRLRRRLKSLLGRDSRPPEESALADLKQCIARSQALVEQRRQLCPAVIHYPPELPVSERREEVAALIEQHQVIVLCGETGSGKSTQLPKICLELGRGLFGRIGHTQPRRIAARSLASRVGAELDTELGGLVGYKVRFHDRVRPESRIKLLTDGMLLAEIQQDRWLNEYDTLIIDEAHERSLNIDFLLGVLKQLLPKRPELKVIVTSATIDPQRFARHFADRHGQPAPIIEISGRTYPVETRYRPPAEEHAGERDEAMQTAISEAVAELAREGRGDVLVFLSGEREIRETAETLRKHHPPATEILPLYARQGPAEQARVFQPHGARRVVLATNVAETSLTVPGIHYVIDPGFARISRYSYRTKVQRLPVERISQASANQRQGRCGRIANGICIRLYDEDAFQARAEFTEPEIQRTNLAAVILQMKLLGFGAIEGFPFIDAPDSRLIKDGYRTLEELAALDAEGQLTPLGKQLARLPVDPRIGRLLLAGAEHHCLRELLIIAAALSVQDPRERPLEKQQAADEVHATFRHEDSDFLAFVNLWNFLESERRKLSRRKFQNLCRLHFLSWTRVQEWRDIHAQLREQLTEMGLVPKLEPVNRPADGSYEEIHRALLTGLLSNIGVKDEQREYLGARNSRFYIHPGSGLASRLQRGSQPQAENQKAPKWILVAERVETTRHYGRTVAKIQPAWIEAAGAHLIQRSYFEPHWQARAGQVAAFEKVTLYGLTLVPKRRINYGPNNPTEAREIFLRFALTEGDFDTRAPFWRHNAELIDYVRHLEAKSRRHDILVDDEAIYAFYDQRVPSGIYSKPQFEQWLRRALKKQPKLLHMSMQDVMHPDYNREAVGIIAEAFPDALRVGATELPLEYHFDPGNQADGVTLVLPLPLINQLAPEQLEWLVPGLLEERITALLRGLPKPIRKALVPIPDTAAKIAAGLSPSERPLIQALNEEIKSLTSQIIPEDAWDESVIPEHLRMKVRLIDQDGRAVASGEDLIALKRQYGQAGGARFAEIPSAGLEREGLTRWDFGDLPAQIDLTRGGIRLRGYPALVDEGKTVAVRVLDSEASAAQAMRAGLRRLIMLQLATDMRALRRQLPGLDRMRLQYAKAPVDATSRRAQPADLADELIALILDLAFLEDQPTPYSQSAFEQCLTAGKPRLFPTANEVCALAAEILGNYQSLRKQLGGITQINWLEAVSDMREQLDALVFKGFLQQMPFGQLKQYPRYLKAIGQRAEKLFHAGGRDRALMVEIRPLLEQWGERQTAADKAGRADPRLAEIRWMLEELRVSFFAQQLGTAYPVSVKRVKARWRELGL